MFCYKCGNALAKQDSFCGSCGQRVQRKRGGKKWVIPVGLLILVGLVRMIASYSPDAPVTAQANSAASVVTPSTSPTPPPPPVHLNTIPVEQIVDAYRENAAAADQWLLHKRFIVTGTIASINSGIGDVPYVTFENPRNEFEEPQAHFSETDGRNASIAQLRKGWQLSLACTGGSSIIGIPTFDDCAFVE
jgi:hypothetical protein